MASNTPNLNLLKKDPVTDGNDTFNIQTMLNDNWDKIDEAIGDVREELQDINIPPASLTEAGIVQLSNSTSGTREDVAATELAVKTTYDAAVAAQTTANSANLAAAAAQAKADAAETPSGAQAKVNTAVGTLSNLLTSAKGNAVAAINELFTFANNGKSDIASVVGSPATSADTFAQLKTHIQNSKNTLASNLSSKGQSASGTESLSSLAAKVANINVGKRFASGNATSSATTIPFTRYNGSGGESVPRAYVQITGLNFKPRMIFIKTNVAGTNYYTLYNANLSMNGDTNYKIRVWNVSPAGGLSNGEAVFSLSGNATVSSSGFTLPFVGLLSQAVEWEAYE